MEKVTRHADETQRPTDGEAFAFQNHLLLYLFAGNVIPVPRVQCFLKLKLNQELKFDVARDRYTIEVNLFISMPLCDVRSFLSDPRSERK